MTTFFKKTTLTRNIFFIAADIFFISVAVWLAFLLRFEFQIPQQYYPFIYRMIGLAVIFVIPILYFHKLYSFSWSYVSTNELVSLFKAITVAFIFLGAIIYIFGYFPYFINFPRSTIFISYFLVFLFCGGLRLAKRIYIRFSGKNISAQGPRTLIIGAGDAGEQILRSVISAAEKPFFPVGFIDDNPVKRGVVIHGLKVLGKVSDIPEVVRAYQIEQLIIALPSAGDKKIKMAVDFGRSSGIKKIKITPPLSEIVSGQVSFRNLKSVEVEDLLGRNEVLLDKNQIENFIKDKIILITGAAGSIGSELSKKIAGFNPSLLLLLDQDETGIFNISREIERGFPGLKIESLIADITDNEKITEIFRRLKPNIVFHAAAYKHVPLMEKNPDEAVKNNIFGTKILADASISSGAEKFIFISTDKAVNPTSVMGATKRIGEMMCQALNQKNITKFISVRFGNVLNSRGSVIPIFREQIKRHGPVEVTHPEMKRYFMLTSEACLLVLQSGAMGQGGEVFVLDMGKPINILDLAKDMIKLSGLEPDKDIAIVFSGMRPGEKLFEEMLTAEEGTVATKNQKIFMARLSKTDPAGLEKNLEDLKSAAEKNNKGMIIDILKDTVPYYKKNKN